VLRRGGCFGGTGSRVLRGDRLSSLSGGTGSLVSVAGSTGDMLVLLRDASERQWEAVGTG